MSREIPIVLASEQRVALPSFQATFYKINDQQLAKLYGRERVWGMIPLDTEEGRAHVMEREVACLTRLAPNLNARIAPITIGTGESAVDTAIIMNRIPAADFLEARLASGKSLTARQVTEIAQRIAAFHFDTQACPPAEVTSLQDFLSSLMAQETAILAQNHPGDSIQYQRWGDIMQVYITRYAPLLDAREALLGEPIIGHGDIKTGNIAISENPDGSETVHIIDPAPVDMWQINDRRMDAYFLRTDLQLAGETAAADAYWNAYSEAYQQHIDALHLSPRERQLIEESNGVIDAISNIYRLTIFHRLSRAGGDTQKAELTHDILTQTHEQLVEDLLAPRPLRRDNRLLDATL